MTRGSIDLIRPFEPTARDLRALAFIGSVRVAEQGQVADAEFPGLSESVISHRTAKWLEYRLVISDRLGTGTARLRLTTKGRDLLVERGIAKERDLFVPRSALPLKDAAHHCVIVSLVILARRGLPFRANDIVPSWLLQRRVTLASVPDLLLVRRPTNGQQGQGRLLAYEVDYSGGERVRGVLLPRMQKLAAWMQETSDGAPWGVVILTKGLRRRQAILTALEGDGLAERFAVELLPAATGRRTLVLLQKVLEESRATAQAASLGSQNDGTTATPTVPGETEPES